MAGGPSAGRCPFLREAQVKSCAASGIRKQIVRLPVGVAVERCTSPGHEQCPVAKQYRSDVVDRSHCPFLQESLVQYCAAAPVVKYIPYTESVLSRCGSGQHRSCELFAAMAGAGNGGETAVRPDPGSGRADDPDRYPARLWYAPNHLWLDDGPGLAWRIGVDSFFAGVFGALERIGFPAKRGHRPPEITITSGGTTFSAAFPKALFITEFNLSLVSNPSRLLNDPYGGGWLFRGLRTDDGGPGGPPEIAAGLVAGRDAGPWIAREEERMTAFVHEIRNRGEHAVTMADGGRYERGLFGSLDAAQRMELAARFFSARAGKEAER